MSVKWLDAEKTVIVTGTFLVWSDRLTCSSILLSQPFCWLYWTNCISFYPSRCHFWGLESVHLIRLYPFTFPLSGRSAEQAALSWVCFTKSYQIPKTSKSYPTNWPPICSYWRLKEKSRFEAHRGVKISGNHLVVGDIFTNTVFPGGNFSFLLSRVAAA